MSMESPLTKTLVKSLAERLHAKHFSEEYDDRFDSVSEAKVRRRRINPMSQGYIDKMDSKRRQLGVSKLGPGGKPQDNKSRELAGQWVMDLVAAHESATCRLPFLTKTQRVQCAKKTTATTNMTTSRRQLLPTRCVLVRSRRV